ncbi:MAG: type IV secretory system conjugative DNA transfer family protein [Cyanobacteria bacterium REEB67]|jgi:type IV secretion system protein VirD4|nr:type IV secretory system conjugative DNA transfer family protein [Cyanobacteria bacterium REEB67]
MAVQIKDSGIVDTNAKDFPILAVNVLDRLGYKVDRASKQLDQILATERLDEQIGQDWWRHEYRVVLRWRVASKGGMLVNIEMEERKGGATETDCQRRCDRIMLELQNDAERAEEAKTYKEKSTVYGSASWGTDQDLRAKGYFQKQADPKRLIIGRTADKEYIQVPEFWTHAHAIVCGRTGVGKSRGFFFPQLIERIATSMIVTEATPGYEDGELYKLTSGWRQMAGHKIYCFNPSDMSSNRINPIDRIRHAPDEEKAGVAEKLADLVIMNGESSEGRGDQTWNRSEKLLLIPLLLHAAAGDPKRGHFGALRWLLAEGPDGLAKVLKNSPSRIARMEFQGWMRLAGETNFKYGVFSGLVTKLNPWMTDQMITLTETTDIDLDAMAKQLFTFYLAVPSRSKDSKLIGSLMMNFLLDHILEIRERMKYPLTMLLDEFTNFGKISGIGDTLSIIRKNKIGLILGFQNYAQLEQVYSKREAQIIIDMPATQVYFKQKNFQEARDLSEAIGRTTVEEATVGDSGRVQESIQGRHLITPDELISLDRQVIVFTADTKPLKLPLTDPLAYEHALSYDPPKRDKHRVSEFVKNRGQIDDEPQESKPEPLKPEPAKETKPAEPVPEPKTEAPKETKPATTNEQPDRGARPPQPSETQEKDRRPIPKRSEGAPDYDL